MMMKKALLLAVLGALLAGCAHQPVYTAQYYRTHRAALKKEIAFCAKAEKVSNSEAKNCRTAQAVQLEEEAANGLFSGGTNNPALLP
ncbi:EexN family lipoprotein [Acidithiobacillus thiooxidans]|uniref:EexN family lipoprotein n=1 Tax=Acidithiobacillus thiooxidans TaxID=930 RepID=UPI0020CB2811|nr:EexN family lipoprotein [Acidithiobacillus thiooxidans]